MTRTSSSPPSPEMIDQAPYFIEILSKNKKDPESPDFIHVYVSSIKPSLCGKLIAELSSFMSAVEENKKMKILSPKLDHLRRVRRRIRNGSVSSKSSNDLQLDILLSSVHYLDQILSTSDEMIHGRWNNIVSDYNLKLVKCIVPGRSATSQQEKDEWNCRRNDDDDDDERHVSWWPTFFNPEKTQEFILEKLELTHDEILYMKNGMIEAVHDCSQHKTFFSNAAHGAVILSPTSKRVVASSSQERLLQTQTLLSVTNHTRFDLLQANPLCTPIMLAIQGVSRKERLSMEEENVSTDQPTGQYICTGYDLFTTLEPSIFESMALVHSRIRRVVFGSSNTIDGGLGGTGLDHAIHCLPGTNHHYRVFRCNPERLNDFYVTSGEL